MIWIVFLLTVIVTTAEACHWSPTTASGSKAPSGFCSGQLIFEDNFDSLDQSKWQHEVTLGGGGSWGNKNIA